MPRVPPRIEPLTTLRPGAVNRRLRPRSRLENPAEKAGGQEAPMTADERCQLTLAFARVLYVNGQATEQTVSAAERLARALGLRATILPQWGVLDLLIDDRQGNPTAQVAADPAGVEMDRVASAMRAIDAIEQGRLAPGAATKTIVEISRSAPAPTWLFAFAAATGAVALAVIFGVQHISAAALIFVSAGAGAFLRRALGRLSTNLLLQPFCAAILAGIVGALAVRYDLSSSLRLVAVCPCMVLVPGPHFLNGALDLINGRISLGAARLIYAGLIVVAILAGLLLGLALLGVSLPTDPTGRAIPLWQDVIAAGVAVAAYSVFFSTPLYMLPWPIAVGMFAHALRWAAVTQFGFGAATGALVACIAVALILTPISRRSHMPFAAIGFAAVVSMMPGVYLFRMASGLLQIASGSPTTLDMLSATTADGLIAAMIILAMSFGLIVPKLAVDYLADHLPRTAN
jgi:uncharacterized membrane protein YjjP (DUF1212 family)